MKLSPEPRLLAGFAAWTGLAMAALVVPPLGIWLGPTLALLIGATLGDAYLVWRRPPVALTRVLPDRLVVGAPAEIAVRLVNPSDAAVAVEVFDELPATLDEVRARPTDARLALPPGGERGHRYGVLPRERGELTFGALVGFARSPLGLLRRRVVSGVGETVRVYPDASRFLRAEALDPHAVLASLGVKPGRARGDGSEFESLREYVRGDDPRRIDWRATARRGHLVTRLYQHERSHQIVVALDTSRLMGARALRDAGQGPTKLDRAIDAALAILYASLAAGDRASLLAFDREVRARLGPKRHRRDLGAFVDAVAPLDARLVEADYRKLTRELVTVHRKRALVVVLTDFADLEPAQMVGPLSLVARHHRVLFVALRDRAFDALETSGGDDPYRQIALDDLAREREETLARLRRSGLDTLDLVPAEIVAPILNRFLALRYG